MWQQLQPFLVAVAIGLLLGFERERSHNVGVPAGSRSFALLSLLGAVASSFGGWAVLAGLAGVAALMALAYFRTNAEDPGTTTEIAALVCYLLGALAYSRPALAVALAVVVAVLLLSKNRIHRFAREVVSEIELEDAVKFFVVAFVVLPLLPDRALGPYGVLNPAKVWLLVVLLTGIGWAGYIGVRALGAQRGLLVTGLAGGFVSATATTASMGRLSRTTPGLRAPLASALAASMATFAQLLVVIGYVDAPLLRLLWPPVLVAAAVLAVVVALVYRSASSIDQPSTSGPAKRPFALRPALVLAAILILALLVGRWGADVLGPRGGGAGRLRGRPGRCARRRSGRRDPGRLRRHHRRHRTAGRRRRPRVQPAGQDRAELRLRRAPLRARVPGRYGTPHGRVRPRLGRRDGGGLIGLPSAPAGGTIPP